MVFLKLGGSLITDKAKPDTPRLEVIQRLAAEIASAFSEQPDLRLLLGHGSGSFGHTAAARYGTHLGASTAEDWTGFIEVWAAAHRLHSHVMDALRSVGLPAMSLPPSASAICESGEIVSLATEPIANALDAGLLPVVLGDVAFDRMKGSAIVSTEQVMAWLAPRLRPMRILLAGLERGVYANYPSRDRLLKSITEPEMGSAFIEDSADTDVTGGMFSKIAWAFTLLRADPKLEVRIFSGADAGNVKSMLQGAALGTQVLP